MINDEELLGERDYIVDDTEEPRGGAGDAFIESTRDAILYRRARVVSIYLGAPRLYMWARHVSIYIYIYIYLGAPRVYIFGRVTI